MAFVGFKVDDIIIELGGGNYTAAVTRVELPYLWVIYLDDGWECRAPAGDYRKLTKLELALK